MTPDRLKELRALCDTATPGPWRQDYENVLVVGDTVAQTLITPMQRYDDAAFIATARTALPEALDEIGRLREALRGAEVVLDGLPCGCGEPQGFACPPCASLEAVRAALDRPPAGSR